MQPFSIVIHGGAGTILKEDMTPELERAYIDGLDDAVQAGYAVLEQGGSATNAVKAAVVVLEDNLLFNAGRGSVFTKKVFRRWMPRSWMARRWKPGGSRRKKRKEPDRTGCRSDDQFQPRFPER